MLRRQAKKLQFYFFSFQVYLLITAMYAFILAISFLCTNTFVFSLNGPKTLSHFPDSSPLKPVGFAFVDYSTATEYVEEHYNIPKYFGEELRRNEPIFNARQGVLEYTDGHQIKVAPPSLDKCGFQLFSAPTQVQNYQSLKEIQLHYVDELKTLIPRALGVLAQNIESITIWHPTLRGEEISVGSRMENQPGLAPIASRVHIDTDVNAFRLEGLCNMVDKNRVDSTSTASRSDKVKIDSIKAALMKDCEDHRRFILLNIWRPIVPCMSAPLGLLATKYDLSLSPQEAVFPKAAPCPKISQWYIFSNMQPDECIVFKQYDRRSDKISDVWHCALHVQHDDKQCEDLSTTTNPRKSFDIKAMVVLKEGVPPYLDRLEQPTLPVLTWEESGEFCDSQAKRLKAESRSPSPNRT
jgi:hypothetical protein